MNIIFRVDASIKMGTGHVMRCRTLANELRRQGAHVHFVTRAHFGHLGDLLSNENFKVSLLPRPTGVHDCENQYLEWLGVSQLEDAVQTIAILGHQSCDWLIVDHYGLDQVWELQLKSHTRKLMVIDDLANRTHDCDVLLDQNYVAGFQDRYRHLVPANCQLLLGPRYALVSPEYGQYRDPAVRRPDKIRRILVFMGGTDNQNTTGKVLIALSAPRFASLDVDLVIGVNSVHKASLIEQAKARPNTHIHGPRAHLADLMAVADLAIGAGGATSWERLSMGLPSIVISIAENQVATCEALAACEAILYLGGTKDVDVAAIESAVTLMNARADTGQLRALAVSHQVLVDEHGTNRVAEVLNPTPAANLRLRPANDKDVLIYFNWVNDPSVRSSAFNSEAIDLTTHFDWFNKKLLDKNTHLYICEAENLPVGQIRLVRQGDITVLDYSLDILVRGRGWACRLIRLGIEATNIHRPTHFSAVVKQENVASAAAFLRAGFIEQISDNNSCIRNFILPLVKSSEDELL